MILFYDTETSGLPKRALPEDHPSQPRLVELGYVLTEDDGATERAAGSLVVRPDGWGIEPGAAAAHGITTVDALRYGVPVVVALALYTHLRAVASTVVGHHLEFDERIIRTEVARTGRRSSLPDAAARACTMELLDPVMALPPTAKMVAAGFGHKTKRPTLGEGYAYLFGEELVGAHSALVDARATARVYAELLRRGIARPSDPASGENPLTPSTEENHT